MVSRRAQSRVQLTPPFPVRRADLDRSCHRVWCGWGVRHPAASGRRSRSAQPCTPGTRSPGWWTGSRNCSTSSGSSPPRPTRSRRPRTGSQAPADWSLPMLPPNPIEARRAVAQGDAGQRRPHHQGDRVGNRRRHDDMAHRDRNVEAVQQFDFGARWRRSARKTNRRRKQRERDEDEPCLVVPATPTQGNRRGVGRSQRWQHRPRWRFRLLRSPWTCTRICA